MSSCIWVLLVAWLSQVQPSGITLADLQRMAAARRAHITSIEMTFTQQQEPLTDVPDRLSIQSISRTMLIDVANQRYRMERTINPFAAETADDLRPGVFAYDGKVEYVLDLVNRAGAISTTPATNYQNEARIITLMMLNPPAPGGLGVDDGSLESLLKHAVLRDSLEEVGDRSCYVVDAVWEGVHYATVWLDAERDLLPVKGVLYGQGGSAVSTFVVASAMLVEDGAGQQVWVPLIWDTEARLAGRVVRTSIEVDAGSIAVNPPLEPESFEVAFPPGTTVADWVAGLLYTIGDDGRDLHVHSKLSSNDRSPFRTENPEALRDAPHASREADAETTPVGRGVELPPTPVEVSGRRDVSPSVHSATRSSGAASPQGVTSTAGGASHREVPLRPPRWGDGTIARSVPGQPMARVSEKAPRHPSGQGLRSITQGGLEPWMVGGLVAGVVLGLVAVWRYARRV